MEYKENERQTFWEIMILHTFFVVEKLCFILSGAGTGAKNKLFNKSDAKPQQMIAVSQH
jgi:hypothetical protein